MQGMHVASGTFRASERVLSSYLLLKPSCPGQTKHEQVYHALQATVRRLGPGYNLPTAGEFASLIGVSRGTVVSVYERLAAEGYLKRVRGWGALINNVEKWTCPMSHPTTPSEKSSS
jgi:GntR family transcriptional regulator / MocR family aminotransferase